MVKQYVISPAYTGNDSVYIYEDGIKKNHRVMSYWETAGFCNALELDGYTRAYDLDQLKNELETAKEAYEIAKKNYEDAIPFALIKHT
jgi:hypothetical protein